MRIAVYFSLHNLKVRKIQSNVFQVLKGHICQPRLLYLVKLSTKVEELRETFHHINNQKN